MTQIRNILNIFEAEPNLADAYKKQYNLNWTISVPCCTMQLPHFPVPSDLLEK